MTFDGSGSSDPDGTIMSYDWDFGDGTVVLDAGPTPTHAYAAVGLYNVTLTVTDDAGTSDSDMTTADIGGRQPAAGSRSQWAVYRDGGCARDLRWLRFQRSGRHNRDL